MRRVLGLNLTTERSGPDARLSFFSTSLKILAVSLKPRLLQSGWFWVERPIPFSVSRVCLSPLRAYPSASAFGAAKAARRSAEGGRRQRDAQHQERCRSDPAGYLIRPRANRATAGQRRAACAATAPALRGAGRGLRRGWGHLSSWRRWPSCDRTQRVASYSSRAPTKPRVAEGPRRARPSAGLRGTWCGTREAARQAASAGSP